MNNTPVEVVLVSPKDTQNDDIGCLNVIGGFVWIAGVISVWCAYDLFDTTLGRFGIFIAAFIAWKIGYRTTTFLVYATLTILIGGALASWILGISVFDAVAEYIGIGYQYLFK